ncbi:MAG: PAS domain S-box protein [Rhodobiaceae bacterium]|nr:PAS domain S-box protein [Rhodobiaceae bacterium]MCC0018144.1 PAS domain S-box protein [Rhodobiaceae bacterium]MCC0042596.1 PAS domain S-box protein [Rhodobiaceae bacterium]MCC0051290.1 PAS domain S-box protein [Rhodobiaceae bacterium]
MPVAIGEAYLDYQQRMERFEHDMDALGKATIGSLAESIWTYDRQQTRVIMESLVSMQSVTFASLNLVDGDSLQYGNWRERKDGIKIEYDLVHSIGGEGHKIGNLVLYRDTKNEIWKIIKIAMSEILFHSATVFICATSVLMVFMRMITRRVLGIASDARNFTADDLRNLDFDREDGAVKGAQDEIDELARSVATLKRTGAGALMESDLVKRKYQYIFNESVTAIVMFDDHMKITDFNEAALEMTGYTREELAELHARDIFADADPERDGEQVTLARRRVVNEERALIRKNGSRIIVLKNSMPLSDGAGGVVGLQSTLIDITRRKEMEREVLDHRDHLETLVAERTAELARKKQDLEAALQKEREYSLLQKKIVAMVSHELRTPLTIIDGTAQRMSRRRERMTPGEIETRIQTVRGAVRRLVSQIDLTLYASSLESGRFELRVAPVNVQDLIAEACDRQREITPAAAINVDIGAIPDGIPGDRKLLDLVFTNLIGNAVKYSLGNAEVRIGGRIEGDRAVISISDRGIGIPPEELAHVFQPFFRGKNAANFQGSGVGLSTAKDFVELHGGTITAESAAGCGTTFTVFLPLAQQDNQENPGQVAA